MMRLGRLHTLHHGAMYLATLLASLAVMQRGAGPIMGGLLLLSLPLSWVAYERQAFTQRLPAAAWNVALLGAIGLTAVQLYTSEASIITQGVRFIMMLTIIKLYSRKGERDDWQIYALTFLLMAAGTAVNDDLSYGLVFAAYVLVCTFGLAMFHLSAEVRMTRQQMTRAPVSRLYLGTLIALALSVFLSSVGIFFTFPRVGLGFFATKTREAASMVGFNDKVELGSHGLIRDNPTVALRVEFFEPDGSLALQPPPDVQSYHWRIMGFDQYDGRGWARTRKEINTLPTTQREPNTFKLFRFYPKAMEQLLARTPMRPRMQLYLEPLGAPQIPILWPTQELALGAMTLNLPFDPKAGRFEQTDQGDVSFARRNQMAVLYELRPHAEPDRSPLRAATGEPPLEVARYYLQLPPDIARVEALARQVIGAAATPYEQAERVEAHLQTSYAYTTDLPPVPPGVSPIDAFLFQTKRGHCEYYATAMVLMLRAVGVPARLVNGFLGGQWYSGGYLAVRQGDAHAWVEVYIPDYGWVPFDPTPSGQGPPKVNPLRQWFNQTYDAMRFSWNKWFIEYDLDQQLGALRQLGQALSPKTSFADSGDSGERAEDADKKPIPLRAAVIALGLLVLCIGAWDAQRRARRSGRRPRVYVAWAVLGAALGALWMAWFLGPEARWLVAGVAGPLLSSGLAHVLRPSQAQGAEQRSHALFLRLERVVARSSGLVRSPDEGPKAYLDRLAAALPEAQQAVRGFERLYLSARFGGAPLDESARRALRDHIDVIQRAARAAARRRS